MKRILQLLGLVFLPLLAFGQGGNLGSGSSPVERNIGQLLPGVNISICQPLATTAATVTSNVGILTMASNPVTAGFVAGQTIQVTGFTGGDTFFNIGSFTNGTGITAGATILSVTSTTITYSLVHANASAGTNGTVLQMGNATTSCAGLSTITSDPGLVTTLTQPLSSDGFGNWNAYAAAGVYYAQFYGAGITTTLRQFAIACVPGSVAGTCGIQLATLLANNNAWTGNQTHSGTETFSSQVLVKQLGNTFDADQFSGADICAKIAAAIAAASNGALIDATNFTGSQVCASNPFSAILGTGKGGQLKLGEYTIVTSVPWIVPQKWTVLPTSRGDAGGTGTTLQASASISFDSTNAVLELGDTTPASHGVKWVGGTIDCNSVASSVGIYSNNINENSIIDHPYINNCAAWAINVEKAGSGVPQNFEIIGPEMVMKAASNGCVRISGGATTITVRGFEHGTCVNQGLAGTQMTNAFLLDNVTGGLYARNHVENAVVGYQLGLNQASSGNTIIGESAPSGATVTSMVDISNANSVQSTTILSIQKGGATNSVNDHGQAGVSRAACTITNDLGFYAIGDGNPQGLITNATQCNSVFTGGPNFLGGVTLSAGANIPSGQFLKWNSDSIFSRFGVAGLGLGSTGSGGGQFDGTLELRNLTLTGATSGTVQILAPAIAASSVLTLANNSTQSSVVSTSFTTTAAASDTVTVTGATASSHCWVEPTNSGGAGGIASVFLTAPGANQVVVNHTATMGWTFNVFCTVN